jgi:hypothetical protein
VSDDRTVVTELGTALGTLGDDDLAGALRRRPAPVRVDPAVWERLDALHAGGRFAAEFAAAFANGRAFLRAADGLRGRLPRLVEWTGGRRPPGDEVAPIDLRIDHVYLISCKYDSAILANTSPPRLFDGLLAASGRWDRGDWYEQVAPDAFRALYLTCRAATGLDDLPDTPGACTRPQQGRLRRALTGRGFPDDASRAAYARLCEAVSTASAGRWRAAMEASGSSPEAVLWRLLRIGSAPYFVLGIDRRTGAPVQYRIAGPWDWRDEFELLALTMTPARAGQPRVDWRCEYRPRLHRQERRTAAGHVEIRWSHGRFAQPPEAKIYLDTPMEELPGYHRLTDTPGTPAGPQLPLWSEGPAAGVSPDPGRPA